MHFYAKVADLRNLPITEEEETSDRQLPVEVVKGVSPFDMSLPKGSEPALRQAEKDGLEFVPIHVRMSTQLIGQSM